VRWWLNTDHKQFSVDNAAVRGMDFSALDPSVWMVQWIDGKGEIERQTVNGENENGLRERFIDVTPFAPYFQEFLERLPDVTLPQAKKVQIDLINEIYNAKRQAPFHYPVAAGDYWWDASDASASVNSTPSIQVILNALNSLIAKVNTLAHEINSIVVTQVNANVVNGVNATVVSGVNGNIVGGINAVIVTPGNALVAHINSQIIDVSNSLRGYIDGTLRAQVQSECRTGTFNIGEQPYSAAIPGIAQAGIPASNISFGALGDGFGAISGIGGIAGIAGINWTDQAAVGTLPGSSFIPIGNTTPVTLTAQEVSGIQSGIAARANSLNLKRNSKITAVNALITVPAVIAYDVTTGW
jgi:hypothetical protein